MSDDIKTPTPENLVMTWLLHSEETALELFEMGLKPELIPRHQKLIEALRIHLPTSDGQGHLSVYSTLSDEVKKSYHAYFSDPAGIFSTTNMDVCLKKLKMEYERKNVLVKIKNSWDDIAKMTNEQPVEYLEKYCKELAEKLTSFDFSSLTTTDNSTKELFKGMLDTYEDPKAVQEYILTGFEGIDSQIRGMRKGELVSLCAFSGEGKSTLAINMANSIINQGYKVCYLCNEMSRVEVAQVFTAIRADLPMHWIGEKKLKPDQLDRFVDVGREMHKDQPIYMKDTRDEWELTHSTMLKMVNLGVTVFFIDYIQQYRVNSMPGWASEKKHIDYVSRSLKKFAIEHNVLVIVLAQLGRESAKIAKDKGLKLTGQDLCKTYIEHTNNIFKDSNTSLSIHKLYPDEIDRLEIGKSRYMGVPKNRDYKISVCKKTRRIEQLKEEF